MNVSESPEIQVTRLDGPTDIPDYLSWLHKVLASGQPIAIDTETGSIESLWLELPLTGRGHCRLYQIGTDSEAWAIDAQDWHQLVHHTQQLVVEASCQVIFANAHYDQNVFAKEGWPIIPWPRCEDVVVAHRLVRWDHYQHGLKPASAAEFGDWALAGKEELDQVMAENKWTWETVPTDCEEYWFYGGVDVCLTVMLWKALQPELIDWYHVEMEYLRITWGMIQRGVLIDPPAVIKAHDYWTEALERDGAVLDEMGFSNPASSKVVTRAFRKLGHSPTEFSQKTGDPTYNKVVLAELQGLGGKIAQAAEHLIRWRSNNSWRNGYGRKLLGYMDSLNRVHPVINTMQARTGRSAITDPPLQTIPKKAITRNMFIAGAKRKLLAADYDGQEIREQAAMSGDPAMLEFFERAEGKFHSYVSDLVGIPYNAAKTIVYARSYGASSATMARTAHCTVTEMDEHLREMDNTFPGVIRWKEEVTAEAERRASEHPWGVPWVELPSGRKAPLDRGREYTQTANTHVQGYGADVYKLACTRMAQEGLDEFLVLPMHDEAVLSVPEGDVEQVSGMLRGLMEDHSLRVPLTVSVSEPLDSWGDAYADEEDEEF